jgi:hypothetical protein
MLSFRLWAFQFRTMETLEELLHEQIKWLQLGRTNCLDASDQEWDQLPHWLRAQCSQAQL